MRGAIVGSVATSVAATLIASYVIVAINAAWADYSARYAAGAAEYVARCGLAP